MKKKIVFVLIFFSVFFGFKSYSQDTLNLFNKRAVNKLNRHISQLVKQTEWLDEIECYNIIHMIDAHTLEEISKKTFEEDFFRKIKPNYLRYSIWSKFLKSISLICDSNRVVVAYYYQNRIWKVYNNEYQDLIKVIDTYKLTNIIILMPRFEPLFAENSEGDIFVIIEKFNEEIVVLSMEEYLEKYFDIKYWQLFPEDDK